MTRIYSFGVLTLAMLFAGCAYPNQFRSVRADSPHAVLRGEGVKLMHINEQPTSFWRTRERFRVPPGSTTVRVISGYRGDVHYPLLRFIAEAGHSYSVQRQQSGGSDTIVLRDGDARVVAQMEREQTR
ncbi:MAG: hypothetical protein RLY20_2423 [Verrucomicrobiota bacterium]